ncbi:MAG: patatin-like phospholipase family protein [Lutibacter sp.]|nr:patatin-like phospholipase family protein [Lutibacter sp.]
MKQKVALVLSSGGSKGLAHIGIINELEKQGFEISSVSGSSIGSVIGGLCAMDKLPEYTEWVKTLNKKNIWDLMDFTLSSNGLIKGEKVFNKMKTFIPDMLIEDMRIPFTAVATDIINEKEVVFSDGSFYEAIRASVAIPSLITPVKYKDTLLIDGGVLNPVPIQYVARENNDILVVVNLYGNKMNTIINPKTVMEKQEGFNLTINDFVNGINKFISSGDQKSLGYFSLLNTATYAMVHKLAKDNVEKHKPDIVINIPFDSASTFDFFKADELIKLGEDATIKAISEYLNSRK